jgi:hypothetical protein
MRLIRWLFGQTETSDPVTSDPVTNPQPPYPLTAELLTAVEKTDEYWTSRYRLSVTMLLYEELHNDEYKWSWEKQAVRDVSAFIWASPKSDDLSKCINWCIEYDLLQEKRKERPNRQPRISYKLTEKGERLADAHISDDEQENIQALHKYIVDLPMPKVDDFVFNKHEKWDPRVSKR